MCVPFALTGCSRAGPQTLALELGPEGYGAVLLEALRWLAAVTAAGLVAGMASDEVIAFVEAMLEEDRREWRFEELTVHGAAFVRERYQRAATDPAYRQALAAQASHLEPLVAALRQWHRDRR
ncbi:MAG: hypothetical protein KatS3mg131_1104 [Candidatus Tectimicrobiota bacterium]|nr:MAG: hypothetical protein KatS3mg131_1104 [Candidatus Tectomicrobia bacterium]